jgi:hypothetical protein
MNRPPSLVGTTVGGAYICAGWELRVTARCLDEDLNAASTADFEDIRGLEIIKALVGDRSKQTASTRQVSPLTCGKDVWVLARGHDHRGATFHDDADEVIWLLAYGRHRSGDDGDFFPFCKGLDAEQRLLPTQDDYRRMYVERDRRFAAAVRVEAPVILRDARAAEGEHRCIVGGELSVALSIEIDEELDATAITVAFSASNMETIEQGQLLLAALSPGKWEMCGRMPSRELKPTEVAFTIVSVSGQVV